MNRGLLSFLIPVLAIHCQIQIAVAQDFMTLKNKADACYEKLIYDSALIYYFRILNRLVPCDNRELYCEVRNKYASSLFWLDKLDETAQACRENVNPT